MKLPRSVETADVKDKVVLVRSDLNVPLEDGRVADDARIRASLPTLRLLLERGAREVRVCSHPGRPKRKPTVRRTRSTRFMQLARARRRRSRRVLENTRFDPGETTNDHVRPRARRRLRSLRQRRVRLCASCARVDGRCGGSTARVRRALCSRSWHLGRLLGEVERPFVIVSGGAKVEDKIGVLENLGSRADAVLIGGKMAEDVRADNPFSFEAILPRDVVAAARSTPTRRRR